MDFTSCPMCGARVPAHGTFCIRCCRPFRESHRVRRRSSDRALNDLVRGGWFISIGLVTVAIAAVIGFSGLPALVVLAAQSLLILTCAILVLLGAWKLLKSWFLLHRRQRVR